MLVYASCSGLANLAVEVPRKDPDSEGTCREKNREGDWENTGIGKRDVDRATVSASEASLFAYLITL
jgi:hypothetical protein